MVYYSQGMELEVVSEVFRGRLNDVAVCRDRLSPSGALYTLLVVRDRECSRTLLDVLENDRRCGEDIGLFRFSQNELMIFGVPFREERKFSAFAQGQAVSPVVAERICVNMVVACLTWRIPWPLLYLLLSQDCVQLTKDNTVYFTPLLDLSELDPACEEKQCVACCARLMLSLLSAVLGGRKKRLKSFELLRKKCGKNAYVSFPELYRDIKVTAMPERNPSPVQRLRSFWREHRDGLFQLLLVLCAVLVATALALLVCQVLFGEIPLLRLFQNTFDVIGTENLHRRGRL